MKGDKRLHHKRTFSDLTNKIKVEPAIITKKTLRPSSGMPQHKNSASVSELGLCFFPNPQCVQKEVMPTKSPENSQIFQRSGSTLHTANTFSRNAYNTKLIRRLSQPQLTSANTKKTSSQSPMHNANSLQLGVASTLRFMKGSGSTASQYMRIPSAQQEEIAEERQEEVSHRFRSAKSRNEPVTPSFNDFPARSLDHSRVEFSSQDQVEVKRIKGKTQQQVQNPWSKDDLENLFERSELELSTKQTKGIIVKSYFHKNIISHLKKYTKVKDTAPKKDQKTGDSQNIQVVSRQKIKPGEAKMSTGLVYENGIGIVTTRRERNTSLSRMGFCHSETMNLTKRERNISLSRLGFLHCETQNLNKNSMQSFQLLSHLSSNQLLSFDFKDTEQETAKKFIEFKPEYLEHFERMREKAAKKLDHCKRICQITDLDTESLIKVAPNKLTQLEINELREEFAKKEVNEELFNLERVCSIVKGLNFFCKFSKPICDVILNRASWKEFKSDEIIFRQGDYGDKMYVILRGSCKVKIKTNKIVLGKQEERTVACLYDGASFGEYSMLGTYYRSQKSPIITIQPLTSLKGISSAAVETDDHGAQTRIIKPSDTPLARTKKEERYKERTKRAATIQCAESCEMLSVDREHFMYILINEIQQSLEDKIKALTILPFFRNLESLVLVPLANTLTVETFKFGERMLVEGKEPEGLAIIADGHASLVSERRVKKSREQDSQVKGLVRKLKKMDFTKGNLPSEMRKPHIINQNNYVEYHKTTVFEWGKNIHSKRSFENDEFPSENPSQFFCSKHIEFKKLARGDYYGIRSFLANDISKEGIILPGVPSGVEPAKLSVISASTTTTVYFLHKSQFHLVPLSVRQAIVTGIQVSGDFDTDFNFEYTKKEMDWEKKKDNIFRQKLNEQWNERNNRKPPVQKAFKDY